MTKFVAATEVNQQRCLEESGQWLENVDCTHLVLASGKLVLQRILKKPDLTPFIKISRRMNYDITDDNVPQ